MAAVTFCDTTDHCLRLLRQHPRLAELAAFAFDFDLAQAERARGLHASLR
ncbi:hypothetical protein ACWCYL_34600 [Streptomyces sp. 900105755]